MFSSERAGLVRPKRFWLGLGWLLLALAPLALVSAFLTHGASMTLVIYTTLFGSMSLSYGMRSTAGARVDAGKVEVTDDAVTFAGKELVKRADLAQAFVVPRAGRPLVRLERKGRIARPLFVELDDMEEATTFIRALGLDAEHTAAEMRIASMLVAWPVGKALVAVLLPLLLVAAISMGLAAITQGPTLVLLTALSYFVYVFGVSFAPTTVRVGTDGIVSSWLGRTRFIAHSDIAKVSSYDEVRGTKRQRGVRVELKNGEVVRLPTGQRDIAQSEASQLERRIDEAREAHARGATTGATDVLARGDRTMADWIEYLRGVGAGAVGPRAPAIPSDVLLRVVEDSKAAPLERASAAIAAMASGDDDVKKRIRIASDTTVSPKLRVALEQIAEEEDVEEALAKVATERAR